MKKEDLFDTLGDINSEYIMEAYMKNKRKNRFAWTKWGTIAACFALLLVLGIPMINNLSPVVDDNNGLMENSEVKKELEQSGIQDLNNKEEVQNVETEPSHGADNPVVEMEGNIDEDVPADSNGEYNEAVTSSDLTKDTSKFFGGSYTDNNGNFVIVLTEDTPENRAAICKELGRNENNTTFVTGTYTLEYLTELQAKISKAMANKELPFVVSSGLSETTNSIVVGVTTTDEAELVKVYAFDTVGGAIKIEFSSSATTDLLLAPKAE